MWHKLDPDLARSPYLCCCEIEDTDEIEQMNLLKWISCIFLIAALCGCSAATKVVKNEHVEMKDYRDLYLVPPKQDPRSVLPKVMEGFRKLGINVRLTDPDKPLAGAEGTGFLITDEGHIMTAAHVLGEETDATIWLQGQRYEADLVAIDKEKDLAILQLKQGNTVSARPLSFKSSENISMGEEVFTIGFPISNLLGNTARLSRGLVSAVKGIKDSPDQLQISAEIQSGNSGGPVFGHDGLVLGIVQQIINPWIVSQDTSGSLSQNVNFAIKSDIALRFIHDYSTNIRPSVELASNVRPSVEFASGEVFVEVEEAIVKIRSGIESAELRNKPKLIALLDYENDNVWDMWYRFGFKYFVFSFYDYDSRELLFHIGHDHDNIFSHEEAVIEGVFADIKNALGKN